MKNKIKQKHETIQGQRYFLKSVKMVIKLNKDRGEKRFCHSIHPSHKTISLNANSMLPQNLDLNKNPLLTLNSSPVTFPIAK